VNIKIAGKWMFIPLKMVLIGIDPYPYFSLVEFAALSDRILYGKFTSKTKTVPSGKLT